MTLRGVTGARIGALISVFVATFLLIFMPFTSTCKPGELVSPKSFVLDSDCRVSSITALIFAISIAFAAAWIAHSLTSRRYPL